MTIETKKFVRKPFYIDAVQVTEENLGAVAKWCKGDVTTVKDSKGKVTDLYVKVRVHRPLNERQTKAYIGDYVLYAGSGYKVYTSKAFMGSFELADLERMAKDTARRASSSKAAQDENLVQLALTEKIEELMTGNQQAVLASIEFKEPSR